MSCLLGFAVESVPAQSWLDTRAEIEQLAVAGDSRAALDRSPELLRLVAEEFGAASDEAAESYLLLGRLQSAQQDFAAAEGSILDAIDIYEQNHGGLAPVLIGPLLALGDALGAGGAHDLALVSYEQARGISRRSFGLFNVQQVEALQRMADSTAALGDLEAAYRLRLDAIELLQQAHGPAGIEVFEAIDALAAWLSENELYRQAGNQYRSLAFTVGREPLDSVRVLRLAAANYRLAADTFPDANGPRRPSELLSALEIVESLPQDLSLLRGEILLELGDWYIVFQEKWSIEEAYLGAWDAVSRLENGGEIKAEWFSSTVPLRLAALRSRHIVGDRLAARGWVELEFTVNENGTADDIDVVAADPAGLIDGSARRRIDNSRFRPGIVDGRLVATRRSLRFDFFYEPDRDDSEP